MLTKSEKFTNADFQALNNLDDATLDEKHRYHSERETRDPRLGLILCSGGFIGVITSICSSIVFDSAVFLASTLLALAAIMYGQILVVGSFKHKNMAFHTKLLSELDPVYCSSAVSIIELCPAARSWRDQAIEEPRALRGFDSQVIDDLYEKQKTEEKARSHRVKCQQLHGLAA